MGVVDDIINGKHYGNYYEEKKKKKKKQQAKDIAPVKTTTNNSGFFSNDTINAVTDFATNNKLANTWKEQFKTNELNDIWSNGYQFGDVTKTLLTGNRIFNPFVVTAEKLYDTGKKGVEKGKELINGEGNFVKNSKAIDEAKEELKSIWSNGYDFGDLRNTKNAIKKGAVKTILGTGADVGTNLIKGELQTAEGLVDTGRYIASDLVKWAGYDETAKGIRDRAIQNTTGFILGENDLYNNPKQDGWAKKIDEYSVFGDKIDQINQSLGQQAFRIGLQKALMGKAPEGGATDKLVKGLNQLEIFAGSYGQAKSEALMNGADEKTANLRGIISGTTEYISENLFDSLPGFKTGELKGATKLKDLIGKSAQKAFGKNGGKAIVSLFNGFGEGFEEILSNVLDTIFTDTLNYVMPEYTYGMKEGQGLHGEDNILWKQIKDIVGSATSEESKEAFITSLISTFITGTVSNYANTQQRQQIIEGYAQDNNMSVEKATELFDAISQLRQNQLVDENTGFTERMETEENVNQQLQQEIQNGANLEELFKATPKTRAEQQFTFTKDELKNIKSEQQKVLANDLQRINNKKEFHDTYNIVNRVQAINKTQQYHLTTTEGLYEMGIVNKNENGDYIMPNGTPYVPRGLNYGTNGDIYVNVDVGTQSGTQAMYHEMFEGFKKASPEQYDQFKQMVRDIVGEQAIQDEVAQYKQMYGDELTNNIEDEIINDKFGELAENQKFINRIADNRSVLEKFVDSIKNMIKYVKGTPQERQLIKLQNKLEKEFAKRYKATDFSQNEGETAYSTISTEGAENLSKSFYEFKDLYNNYNKAQKLYEQLKKDGEGFNSINAKLKEKTQWFRTKYGDWATLISDKGAKITKELQKNKTYNLGDIFDHPLLYKAYPGIEKLKVITTDMDDSYGSLAHKKANNDIEKAKIENNRIKLNNDYINDRNYVGTLLHEINHYIQLKEGFNENSRGASSSIGEEEYRNNLGEIMSNEANIYRDLTQKQLNDNIVLPEQAKENPRYEEIEKTLLDRNESDFYSTNRNSTKDTTENKKQELERLHREFDRNNRLTETLYDEAVEKTAFSLQSNKDSNGRTLSEQQQNYFKDSKVVDENGNLQVVYHGTTKPGFTTFNASKGNSQFGKYKFGNLDVNYFTASKDTARGYTDIGVEENGNIYETYLNITNPYIVENSNNSNVKTWRNIKDNNIRQYETEYYDRFENKWNTDKSIVSNLDAINEDLFPFGYELRLNEGYAELYRLEENTESGESLALWVYADDNTSELFNEGIKNYVYGESFDDYIYTSDGIARWVLTQNKNGKNFDGIIIPDILDTGPRGNIGGEPTTDYITFYSNQIKNVDNTNPTSNADIRYSLAPTGEMVDNKGDKVTFDVSEVETDIPIRDEAKLMVLHNLGENKMNGIMDLDGIPVPSLAITNPNKVDHSGFGEATLIFNKSTIDPSIRENEVYDRDVWSPTQPQIDYDIKSDELWKIEKGIYNKHDAIAGTALNRYFDKENLSDNVDRYGIEGTIEEAKNSDELKYIYYKTLNPDFEILKKTDTEDLSSRYSNELLQEFNTQYGKEIPNWMNISDEQRKEVINDFRNYWKPILEARRDEIIAEENAKPEPKRFVIGLAESSVDNNLEWLDSLGGQDKFIEHLHEIQNNGGIREVNDIEGTKEFVNNNINQEEYNKWVDDTLGNLLRNAEKGIYNGKDYITNNGRRTFKQTHDKYTLENLVKALTKGDTKGTQQTMVTGYGQIQAQLANQFNSIEEIRNAENQIMSDEEAKTLTEQLQNAINEDIDALADRLDGDYFNMNNASEMIFEYAGKKNRNEETFRKIAKDYANHGIPSELIQKITNDLEQLKNMPTDYFEAKPQRAVGLDEIGIGLIPQSWSDETKQRMKDKGIKYIEYDSTIPGERQRIEQSLTDYMFSLTSNQNIRSGEIAPVNTTTEEQLAPIREDISNISTQLNNLSNQIETLQNGLEISPRGYVESYKEQRNENIPTRQLTEDEANLRQEALMNDEGYLRSLEEQADYDANAKFIKTLTNEIQPQLEVGKDRRETLENLIRDAVENDLTIDEIRDRVQGDFGSYKYTIEEDGLKEVKKEIRHTPLNVSDYIKKNITDYGDFQKSNFGKMTFSKSGMPVDVVYKQFVIDYPTYFSDDIWNETDQLLRISEVANRKGDTFSEPFDADYLDNISDYIHESVLNYKANNQLNSQASLDKDIQFDFTEDIAPTTIRTQESIDEYIDNRDIAPVRQKDVKPKSKIRDRFERMRTSFNEKIRNRNYIIDEYSRATGNKEIKFTGDNLNNVSGEASYNINGHQTDIYGNETGKGVHDLFKPARKAGKYEAFNDYLVQKSNIERHAVGKGSKVPLVVSQQLVQQYEAENPEFIEWAKPVYKYFDNVLQDQVDSGLITQDRYNDYRGENGIYRSYVPFYPGEEIQSNIKFDDNGEVKSYTTLKRSKGNSDDVSKMLSVEDAMAKQTYAYKRAIRQNELFKEIVNSSEKYDAMFDGDMRDNPTNLDDSLFVDENGDKIVSAYVDGQKVSAKISDELYNELLGANEERIKQLEQDFSMITNPLQKASNIRRKLITTWNPAFLARNAIKDVQDAVINSKHTGKMLKNLAGLSKGHKPAIIELAQAKTTEAKQFLALYGSELYGDYSGKMNKFTKLNELIELAPRYAEYLASLQSGETQNEAMYNAREVTTNFGRGGYVTRALNRNGFTFLNANVQGLDKVVRNLSGESGVKGVVAVVTKGALFAVLPSILNDLLYGFGDDKDEEYESLPDYIKDNYYLIKTEGNHFVRIPKGRINAVFGSMARRTIESIETGENQFDGYIDNAWSQIGVGDLGGNNIFSPITQAFGSENGTAWYGGDIVPTRLQNKPAEEQTDAKIDAISNFIGEAFNISPYKVNYVLDQYSGALGDILLPMITPETKSGAETPIDYLTAPIKDAFVVNSIDDNKYAGEFYDLKDKLEKQKNSSKATDEDVLKYKYMEGISKQLTDLYKERREVQSDTTLSNSIKYEKVQKIQDSINSLAKEGVKNYQNVKQTEDYSHTEDSEFYKNSKNEWTKVSDSDAEFTSGLTDSEKNSYYNVKNKIGVIYDDYNKKTKGLDYNDAKRKKYSAEKKDKITEAIVNSGLDNYTKAMVYSKYYSSDNTMTNVYNSGYDIDTYITAKNDLDHIRDKYNQKNGYSTEFRKNKTISYINSLDLEIPQKAMLIREYYTSFRSYNKDIVNYVSNLDISYDEKVAILNGTGMTVKGNNVSWK